MFVADESWSKVSPAALVAAGYVGVIGYCSYDTSGKNLTPENIAAYHAAGLNVGLVWETFGQAAQGGTGQGDKEATDFLTQAHALGATGGSVYMVGEDPNKEPPPNWPGPEAYFAAASPIITAAGFRLGDYGSEALVDQIVAQGHATRKWFVGGWSQTVNADLIQQANSPGASTFNGQCDCNYAPAADWGWTEFGAITPTPPPPPPPPTPVHAPDGNPFTILGVDGVFGPNTTRATQWKCGTPADGVFGNNSRKALQRRLGVAQDGIIGPVTVKALQRHVGVAQDGIWGSLTTKGMQTTLNQARF